MSETWLPVKMAPCAACPFRKTAAPGWLGGGDRGLASEYLALAHSDENVVCHKSPGHDAGDPTRSRPCAGLALYRRNVCKDPKDPFAARAREMVGDAHRGEVFQTPQEFLDRHDTEVNRKMMARMREGRRSL